MKAQTLQKVIAFRKLIHQDPQASLVQYKTRQKIKNVLEQFGVSKQCMKQIEPTALVVDISGKAQQNGQPKCIAYRADMDALQMQQTNQNLQYQSKNKGIAHMCGHDGHVACLIGFVSLFMKQLQNIPKNKTMRLLFQPSQQGDISGALLMVKAGVMDKVDQVYGMHNWPTADAGQLWCKQGPVMSQVTILKIIIKGTSGHGSQPQKLKQSARAGVKFYQRAMDYIDALIEQKKGKIMCTLPVIKAGQRSNVISQDCVIEGTIRNFELGLSQKVVEKLKQFCNDLQKEGFKTQVLHQTVPMNVNTKQQANHVLRIGKVLFGEQKVGHGKLPFIASQDFGYFSQVKPGAFFFLSSSRKGQGQNAPMLHNSKFNFNDEIIEKASIFWYQLALDRLGVQIK